VDAYTSLRAARRARETGSPILPGLPGLAGTEVPPTGPQARVAVGRAALEADPWFGRKTSPVKRFAEAVLGNPSAKQTRGLEDNLAKFLELGDTKLVFRGVWDTSAEPLGGKQRLNLHVYLASDEVEIFEENPPNAGKPATLKVFKRARLPRRAIITDDRTRSIEDDKGFQDYYSADEFRVGRTIDFLGRAVQLYAADEATYRLVERLDGDDMRPRAWRVDDPPRAAPIVHPPPYLGVGSEEDSLGSFFSLLPQFPRRDLKKAEQYEGVKLVFDATLVGPAASIDDSDRERKFVVVFYMEDDTLAIWERAAGVSGHEGGQFLRRMRLRNPASADFFRGTDFVPGARLRINAWVFQLGAATEATKDLLANGLKHTRRFGMADVPFVLANLKAAFQRTYGTVQKAFRSMDKDFSGFITVEELREQLKKWGMRMTDDELIVLMRFFDKEGDGRISFLEFVRAFTDADVGEGVGGAKDRDAAAARTILDDVAGAETMPSTGAFGVQASGTLSSVEDYQRTLAEVELSDAQRGRLTRLLETISMEFVARKGETALREQFRRVDADKSNSVDRVEFQEVLREGFHFAPADVRLLEKAFFPPKATHLNYEQFMEVLRANIKRTQH
jgi:Ca2+-binding EF-hand superfamily protein